jgi:pyridoxal phosphate-dependent aminotransferase EpsN
MLVSHRRDWIERARFLAQQARDPAPHYQHSTIGYNYRLSNLLAAVGRGQLRHLDDRVARRRDNNAFYRRAFQDCRGITFMPEAQYGRSTFWLTCMQIDPAVSGIDRERVRLHLESKDIESRPVWKPLHMQPVFAECRVRGGRVAEQIFDTGLCLPSGSSLTDVQRDFVAATFLEAVC